MKKAVVALVIVLLIVFMAVCITLAIVENRRSQETINRVDSKIERCENGR